MSTIRLTTFSLFRKEPGGGITLLTGGLRGGLNKETGKIEIVTGSVPFNSELFVNERQPTGGLLMLYGIRDMLEATKLWRGYARELGCEFVHAEFEFEVGTIFPTMVTPELLQDKSRSEESRFVNIRRTNTAFQEQMLECFSEIAKRDGVSIDDEMSRVWQISTRPNYWDEIFKTQKKLMGGIEVLVIPVADDPRDPSNIRQLAYVRPNAKVVGSYQGREDVEIVLPAPWGAAA